MVIQLSNVTLTFQHVGLLAQLMHLNLYTYNRILRLFSPSGSQTVLVFAHQTLWQYSDGDSLNGGVVGKNRDSEPISGSIACCERFERQVQYTQLRRTMAS